MAILQSPPALAQELLNILHAEGEIPGTWMPLAPLSFRFGRLRPPNEFFDGLKYAVAQGWLEESDAPSVSFTEAGFALAK